MAAVAIPGTIMKATSLLDNPWSCAHERAKKGGIALATQVLLPRAHGRRPVVLVGFSLGARLVFECLEELAKELDGGRADAAGIVQHVVLLGLPGPSDAWITLAGLARETSTIRLGTMMTSATFRHRRHRARLP
mgnify:CR=1 FL=1